MSDFDRAVAAAAALPAPPCPWWCEEPPPHRWQFRDHAGASRYHLARFAGLVIVEQTEHSDEPPSPIEIHHALGESSLDAAQARQLAAALLNAADKLDEIAGPR
jgi:hypothetical protein